MLTKDNCIIVEIRAAKMAREAARFCALDLVMACEPSAQTPHHIAETANDEFMTALRDLAEACGYRLAPVIAPISEENISDEIDNAAPGRLRSDERSTVAWHLLSKFSISGGPPK